MLELHAIAANQEEGAATFAVAMTREEQRRFVSGMSGDVEASYLDMLGRVNSETSECSRPSDQESIHAAIRETIGFRKLNRMLFDVMEGWAEGQLRALADKSMALGKVLDAMHWNQSLASFLKQQGKYDGAVLLEKQILDVFEDELNARDPAIGNWRATADSICILMLCRVCDVQPLFDVFLSRKSRGGAGAARKGAYVTAACIERKRPAYRFGSTLMVLAALSRKTHLGRAGNAMKMLATTYGNVGRIDESLALKEETLEFEQRVLPANHPHIGDDISDSRILFV